jgi:hypothetical protein
LTSLVSNNQFNPNASKILSMTTVGARATSSTGAAAFLEAEGNAQNATTSAAVNSMKCDGGGGALSAADNAFHAMNCALNDGTGGGSTVNIDGSTATYSASNLLQSGNPTIFDPNFGAIILQLKETGFVDNSLWSGGTLTALCHNQRLYWGTGGSC